MNLMGSEMFMSLNGAANWLLKKEPIGESFNVKDRETAGDYDINAKNLEYILKESEKNGMTAMFTIKQDFFIQTMEARFTLATINVND